MATKRKPTPTPKPQAVEKPATASLRVVADNPAPKPVRIGWKARANARITKAAQDKAASLARQTFKLPSFPPGVGPPDATGTGLAMDESVSSILAWAANDAIFSAFAEGVTFLGYSYLSALAQRAEYRVVSETIASEMTREWIEFESTGEEDKSDRIKAITAAVERFKLKNIFYKMAVGDGNFGRGHIFIDTGDTDDRDELKMPLGDGSDEVSELKMEKGKLRGFIPVEAVWAYPQRYNSTDPLKPNWYKPESWFVMSKEVHATRFLTFVGREVPDMLKPAYGFGGLSMIQMLKPYVDNWLRTRQSVADTIYSFSVSGLKTTTSESLMDAGDQLFERAEFFANMRDNRGIMILDKNSEDWFNVSTPLGTLDALQAQTQEHMAAISRIPLVKLLGISPHGLNASSEGEIRSFYDWIKAFQESLFRPHLTTCIRFIMLSEFGSIDPSITFKFKDLWQLDEAGRSAIEKTKADIDDAYISMGAVAPEEVRKRVASDPESIYHGLDLDPDAMPEPPGGEEGGGLEDLMGGEPDNGEPPDSDNEGGGTPPPKDPSNRLASSVTNRAANFGGAATGGFKGDMAFDENAIIAYVRGSDGFLRPVYAFDDTEFEEEKHPRDKGGKFAKAPGGGGSGKSKPKIGEPVPSYKLHKVLKAAGYKKGKTKTAAGHFEYGHSAGQKIHVKPANPNQKVVYHGFHHVNSGKEGVGDIELAKLLSQIHGQQIAPAVAAPPSSQSTSTQVQVKTPTSFNKKVNSIMSGLGFAPTKELTKHILFEGPNGKAFVAKKTIGGKFEWTYYPVDENEPFKQGYGIDNFKAVVKKATINNPLQEQAEPANKPASLPMGAKVKDGPNYYNNVQFGGYADPSQPAAHYEMTDGTQLYLATNSDKWVMYASGAMSFEAIKGSGQAQLDAEFEKLHPRGEGGQFIKKPGGEIDLPQAFKDAGVTGSPYIMQYAQSVGPVGSQMWELPQGQALVIQPSGKWKIFHTLNEQTISLNEQTISEGTGPDSLVKAFAGAKAAKEQKEQTEKAYTKATDTITGPLLKSELKQVAGQLGSNPGGQYEDAKGNKYYVKDVPSKEHARNEFLAAALFAAAGGNTLKYKQVVDGDKLNVGTQWEELKANNVSQLGPASRKEAQQDFALHAWLANWDAAGTGGDNIGLTQDGKVIPLDFGGSLLYRAKGAPKGAAFNADASEFESLRTYKNPDANALYGDMTADQLKESAKRLQGITDDAITEITTHYGPGDADARANLATLLIARRDAILGKVGLIEPPKKAAPSPPPADVAEIMHHNNVNWTPEYHKLLQAAPKPTKAEGAAITTYTGGAYDLWNSSLRKSFGKNAGSYASIQPYLDSYMKKCALGEQITVNRKVGDDFAAYLIDEAISHLQDPVGTDYDPTFQDFGWTSSDHWSGPLTIQITLPKGAQATAIGYYSGSPSEKEILIRAGSKYRIDNYDPKTKTMKATLIRSGPANDGVWHKAE